MKIRFGIVSNSSSSSFILHSFLIIPKQKKELDKLLDEMNNLTDDYLVDSWGESGFKYFEDNGYYYIETHYLDDRFWSKFKEIIPNYNDISISVQC